MKKIVILSDGWKRKNTYARCTGIYDRAKELEEDIVIHRFNCYGNWSRDKKHNSGEYNIFNLPVLDKYDAVVIECTNTVDLKVLDSIYDRCRALTIPVIDLTRNTGEFYYVGLNNKDAIIQNVDHLYNVHKCRTFAYAGGPKNNYENEIRKRGFIEGLAKYGIEADENLIFDGGWELGCGKEVFYRILEKNGKKFPDAVICGNDAIAAGLCDEAEQNDMVVPRDFSVVGFDNSDLATYFHPQISTIRHNYIQIGRVAMDTIFALWNGEEVDKEILIDGKIMPAESCGCPGRGFVDNRRFMRRQVLADEIQEAENEELSLFEADIAESKDFEELFMSVSEFLVSLGCEGAYIIVDDRIYSSSGEEEFTQAGYDRERLTVGYAIENNKIIRFPILIQLIKHMEQNGKDSVYVYTPIHFREKTIGYTVVKNSSFIKEDSLFFDIQSMFTRRLENLYNHKLLSDVNKRLEAVYNKDPLTGLFNRIAYTQFMAPQYEEYRKDNRVCALTFFDVDDFKKINDRHGHKYGDDILRTIAVVLDSNKPEGGIAYRFGGDEFVVFFPDATNEKIYKFQHDVDMELKKGDIKISMGGILMDPLSDTTLEEYMVLADEKMYNVKNAKKTN